MTNVSKKLLENNVREKLLDQLAGFFSNKNKNQINNLFSDLVTSSEQIMLIKRLAIIIMLHEKHSTYKISKYLLVSDATVRNMRLNMSNDYYQNIVKHYQDKKFNAKAFWSAIEILLSAGLPSRGADRWKSL